MESGAGPLSGVPRLTATKTDMSRIYLSPPDVGVEERIRLLEAFDSNWIAPAGPDIDAFESEFAETIGVAHAVALSSGTAALHLGLEGLGVSRDDDVVTPTLTFAATANAIRYLGANPVFVDVTSETWTMDPDLLEEELRTRGRAGKQAAAVVSVDLYGQCVDYDRIVEICQEYGVPLLADVAEALGSSYRGVPAGRFGGCAAFSFNGNKIITTSGGGMLVSQNRRLADRARHLSRQARDPAPYYQHSEIGYNYRLSNLLAGLGRAQLRSLPRKVELRRKINSNYSEAFRDITGLDVMPQASYGSPNCWLTCVTVDFAALGLGPDDLRLALEAEDIESRPLWKPMHLQPVFEGCSMRGGSVAEDLFQRGLCLPSGSSLTTLDQRRVVDVVRSVLRHERDVQAR